MKRKMKGKWLGVASTVLFAVVLCVCCASVSDASPKIIKMQSIYALESKVPVGGESFVFFAKKVEEYTKGEVQIKLYAPNQLIKSKEVFTALQRGAIEAAGTNLLYYAGVVPEAFGSWLPYAWPDTREAMNLYLNHGYMDVLREATAKHGIHYVVPIACGSLGLITKFPVHKMEDLQGKKIRAAGSVGTFIQMLGGAPVSISPSEQFMALQRGTVDGMYYTLYALEAFSFHEVVDYIIYPLFTTPGFIDILFSQKVWDGLSPAHQDAINRAAMEAFWRSAFLSEITDARAKAFFKEKGLEEITLAPEEFKRFREVAVKLYDEYEKKSDLCAKQVNILKKYWESKGK